MYNIAVLPDGDRLRVEKFRKIFFESYHNLIMLKCCKTDMVKLRLHQMYCRELTAFYEGWNFNSGNYLFTTDTK